MRRFIPMRAAQWSLLAISTFLCMTSGFPNTFTSAVFGQERDGSHKAPGLRAGTSRDEPAARRLYDRVMQEFHKKDYEAALPGFYLFLELYGDSRFAASAQYWTGECQYRLGRYRDAIESFSLALKMSQQKPKLAGATLKMALAYERLGQTEASRILFERLVSAFSDTAEAEIARKHLGPPTPLPQRPGRAASEGHVITDPPEDSAANP